MLIITAIVVAMLMVGVSYAVDVSYWFVHHRHLQTQADAAALAAGDSFQFPCDSAAIANVVHQYDGTTVASGGYNPQVPETPKPPPSQHNLFSQINQANFYSQQKPNDTGLTGNPCNDNSTIDVKLTETNLPGLLPYVSPQYINAQARVQIQQEAAGAQNLPLAIPSPAPRTMTATLVDEKNSNAAIGAPFTMTSADGVNWTSTGSQTITFTSSGSDVGLLVSTGGGSTCGTQLQCYDSTSPNHGIAYVRAWANSGVPGVGTPPVPPQAQDVTVAPTASGGCPQTNGAFSNFISVSSPCTVQLNATALFASGAVCGATPNVGLNLTVTDSSGKTQTPAMTCNNATPSTSAQCTNPNPSCVTTTWTSGPVSIGADNPDGPMTFSLTWNQQFGLVPSPADKGSGDKNGNCTSANPCTGSIGTVQRTFLGAYDTTTAGASRSGPILAANVLDGNNNEIMSVARGTPVNGVTVKINTLNLNFQQQDQTLPIVDGTPYVLHTGGNQGTYAIDCLNNGASTFITNMAIGCPTVYGKTSAPASICNANPAPVPPVCVNQDPGNGKNIAPGIDCRVNGTIDYTTNPPTCNPSSMCASPNHWTHNNTLKAVMNQSPPDPRIVHLLIVDSSAWVGVKGAGSQTPIRDFATFYVTGWSSGAGNGNGADPCPTSNYSGPATPGHLAYTSDDDPGSASNVLLGHFVQGDVPGSIPNGVACVANTFGNCTPVLIK